MYFHFSHLEAALLFALFTSIVMGVVGCSSDRERLRYGLKVFGYFLVAIFGLGWVMHFGYN